MKILVVDDELRIRKLVRDYLVKANYEVVEAKDGLEAIDIFFSDRSINLVILDVMMPGMDGWQVTREIRKNSSIPIIMLTALGDETDELLGFEVGVDEFITKPCSGKVLIARIEAICRRVYGNADKEKIEVAGIVIDKSAHQVTVDGKVIELSFKEFELLTFFLENQGIALSREKILNNVWDYAYYGEARTIDTHVKKIRSKLGEKGDLIETVYGYGYKFVPERQE